MNQCKICSNSKVCRENNWVVTMDNGKKLEAPINEYMCDNFMTTESIIISKRKEK